MLLLFSAFAKNNTSKLDTPSIFSHEVVFYGLNSVVDSAKYQTASIKSYSDWVQASCFLTIVQKHRLDRFVKPAWWFPRWSQRRR